MNFKIDANLMKIPGAQILNIKLADGKDLGQCIVIPAKYNDMLRTKDDGTVEVAPYLNLRAWSAGASYVQACARNHAGEQGYVPPTHTVQVSYREEFQKRAEAAAAARIRRDNPSMSEEDVAKQARYACNIRIADMTPIGQEAQTYAVQQAAVAVAAAPQDQYAQPAPQVAADTAPQGELPCDDLPF